MKLINFLCQNVELRIKLNKREIKFEINLLIRLASVNISNYDAMSYNIKKKKY